MSGVEGIANLIMYGGAEVAELFGNDGFAEAMRDSAGESFTDRALPKDAGLLKDSVLGDKSDNIIEGVGQLALPYGAGKVATGAKYAKYIPAIVQGISAWGHGMNEAYEGGATDGEAWTYGASQGAISAITESFFGGAGKAIKGLGFSRGIGGLDDIFAKKVADIMTKTIKSEGFQRYAGNTIEAAIKAGGEGLEEVADGYLSAVMKKLTYLPDADLEKLIEDENLLEQFIVGAMVSVIAQSPSYVIANKSRTDFVTGLTSNQEQYIKDVAEHKIAEREEAGAKLTARGKNKIYSDVASEVENAVHTAPTTLEEAAKGAVANRTRTASYETLEALSQNNEPITVEEVKKVTRFGKEGAKLVAELANKEGVTLSQAERTVKTAYDAGFTDLKATQVSFENDLQKAAFDAGKVDRGVQDRLDLAKAQEATVYKGTFHENEHTKNYTEAERTMISTFAKGLKMDISTVDNIIASVTMESGKEVIHEANAEHNDGKMRISSTATKVLYKMIMHEGGHRMKQLAPTEFGVLMNALYERVANRYSQAGMFIDDIKAQHDNAGITLDAGGYFEEFAVRELENIFNSAEEFNKWYAEISGNAHVKTAWQKFMDFISELIEDVKRFVAQSKMTKEERAEAKKSLAELEHIKELYGTAFIAAENAATERTKEQTKQAAEGQKNTDTEGGRGGKSFALSDSKSGRANDLLLPYNEELTGFIRQRGDYIVSSFEELKNVVYDAFHNRQKQATAYFGIIPSEIIAKIEKSIPNLPRALNGTLFKTDGGYSIATTLDSIRHLQDDKSLTEDDIIDYLDRMADTIVEFDTVAFDYYYESGNKLNGLLFKKAFGDGVLTSFEIVSRKKRSLNLQTFYMQKGDYKKKKSADSTLLERNPTANVQDEERSNFNNKIPQKHNSVKSDFSLKDSEGKNLTKAQTEYFKDSKVRDEDGNLLVMYQGSKEDFTVFDRKKSSYANLYGRGFYFTKSKNHASQYGKTRAFYLNIKHPVSTTETTITKSQLRKFLEAVAENEDYSFENYGYGATVDSVLQSTYGKSDFLMLNDVSQTAVGDLVEAVELFNKVNGTDFDGIMLDTETVIFNSEQAKLTSNENPTSNPDTRFSLKETNDISAKDQKDLLDIIEHLKGEFEVTKFAKADPKKLAKLTRDILKEYNSKVGYDETYSAIDALYQYIANGEDGHPPVWDHVYTKAYKVAQEIVKNALVVDDYAYQENKSLRDYLRSTPMKFFAEFDNVPSAYENFNEFRKLNMGRLKFTNDGTPIDVVYQELSSLYPEFFDETEQTNTEAQLERIVEVLDSIKATEVNPFDGQVERVSMYLANDLVSRFFDIPQAKPTFADKAERKVVEAKIKGGKRVETVRQQKDAKIKKLIEAQRGKTKRQLDKIREQRDTRVKKEQAKRRDAISKMNESQKAKVLRAKIMRHASDLSKKLVNPTDNQHIPQELRGVVATLLDCINLESNYTYDVESHSYKKNDEGLPTRRTQAFNELRNIYKNIASSIVVDPDLVADGGLLSDVISLADKRIADMNSTELDTIWQTIRAIEASVSTANKVFSQGKFKTILGFAEALLDDNAGKKPGVELKAWAGGDIKRLAQLDMLTPETYFHYLGGAGDSIFRMMRDAQDKHITIMKEVADFRRKTLKDVDVNSLENTFHTVKLGGENVKLTTAQLMELYALMKRGQAVKHIMVGGILPDVTEGKGAKLIVNEKAIRNLTMDEITKALSKLTVEQKKIADTLQKFVSTVLSEYGNEASMKVYNYEKFLEKNYWPIRINKKDLNQKEVGDDKKVVTVANKGLAKNTDPHADNSVRIGSIFDTFADHSSDMATYAAWLGTSEDVNRIRNFVFWEDGKKAGSVEDILDTVHGAFKSKGSGYLEKLLTDVAIGVKGTDNMNPFDKLIGGYKAASVGANLRVIIQQPTAILRALDMIDARYLAVGMVRPLKGWEKAKKYAPIAQWKDWGHFDINMGRQMKDILFDNASKLEKAKQISMWGASMADSLAWGQLWNAVEAETKANNKTLEEGTEAYYETVAKRFTEIVDHTQVVDGILQRSQIMRSSDALTKMATSFMGEPTKQYNMAISAAYDAINGTGDARKNAVKRLGRTAMSLAVAGIINACAQSIIDAMRDDDKEKDYWEKWLAAFVGDGEDNKFINSNVADTVNPLNYVPFAKDVVSIVAGYDVKRMDTETIAKTFSAVTNMYKAVSGTGKYTVAEASAQLFAEIARFYGLPVSNVKRDVKSLVMSVANASDNYLMQYRMEKAMLNINYAGNSKNFMDILFNAYNNDKAAYKIIYEDLLQSGYDAEKIENAMETRMKKAEGVSKASDLSKRYMAPADEKKYDGALSKVKSSPVWKSATPEQRKEAENDLFNFITSSSENTEKARTEAAAYGVDETEYILWQLAIEMADQPKGEKGSGSYDYKEKAEAVNSLNLGDSEIAYFFGKGLSESAKEELEETLNAGIDLKEYVNFKAATSEMKADKNDKGNTIPNSKKKKVVNYLNNANLTDEEWAYFYYEIMNYKN